MPSDPATPDDDRHPRGSSWCSPIMGGDPMRCWCGGEIVLGIGECPECQEDADAE